jgi:trehalose 6-phosphate phosphatase
MRVIRPLSSEIDRVCATLRDADRVLVALDYDGTLAPIAGNPETAQHPPEVADVLSELAASDRFTVAVVSGRSLADLKGKLGLDVICVGNHGLEMEGAGVSFVHPQAKGLRSAVDQVCGELEAAFAAVRGVAVERKDWSATVHYRQAPAELRSWIQATVNAAVRPCLSRIFVAPALEAWEIRPRLQWNKGSAVRHLLGRLDATSPALVCAGDDATDEDMFDILPSEISIKVGAARNTRARFYVPGVPELLEFLTVLARESRAAARDYTESATPAEAAELPLAS